MIFLLLARACSDVHRTLMYLSYHRNTISDFPKMAWKQFGLYSSIVVLSVPVLCYPAFTSATTTPCSVWQNTAMWLRVIKSIKTLTSCNPIFHFVHTHKCLIELKLNTKKFERPNLYILFSLHRIAVINQRNYKAPLLRNAHLLICLSSVATHLKFWWQAFPAFKPRSFVLLGSSLYPGATGTHSAVPWSWTNDSVSRSAGEGLYMGSGQCDSGVRDSHLPHPGILFLEARMPQGNEQILKWQSGTAVLLSPTPACPLWAGKARMAPLTPGGSEC